MSNVLKSDGVYAYNDNKKTTTVMSMFKKKIGRKKHGSFKLQLISGKAEKLPMVASELEVRFTTNFDETPIDFDEVVTLKDLLYSDLPWSGSFVTGDTKLDTQYLFTVNIKVVLNFNKFIFHLRETNDGKAYVDGLVQWNIYSLNEGFSYDIRAGLKQIEVVELFQGYYDGVNALKEHLLKTGYTDNGNSEWIIKDDHGNIVSKIDYTLLGILFFKPSKLKTTPVIT